MEVYEYAKESFGICFGVELRENCKDFFDKWESKYGADETMNAIDISCERYDNPLDAFQKIGGILYNRAKMREKFFLKDNSEEV